MRSEPKTVYLDTPLDVVWDLVAKEQLHMVPVVDQEGYLKGIITAEDLLTCLVPDYHEFFSNFYPQAPTLSDIEAKLEMQADLVAKDVMNKTVYTVYHYHDVFKALSRMMAYNVRILPVMNKREKLVGFIVEKDIFKYLFKRQKHIKKRLARKKAKEQKKSPAKKAKKSASKLLELARALQTKPSKYLKFLKGSKKK